MLVSLHPVSEICCSLFTPCPFHNLPQLQLPPININLQSFSYYCVLRIIDITFVGSHTQCSFPKICLFQNMHVRDETDVANKKYIKTKKLYYI